MEKVKPLYNAGRRGKGLSDYVSSIWQSFEMLNIMISCDTTIKLLGNENIREVKICPHKNLYVNK
jgi:hypothetical protein